APIPRSLDAAPRLELDARGRLLLATLGFLSVEPREPELVALHRCFDNWRGIGDVVAGMVRQEYDLELRRYDGEGWRAIFFQSGFGAFADVACRRRVGDEPMGGSAEGGRGGLTQARSGGCSAARLDQD